MRQQGQEEDDMKFAVVLAHLHVGEVTMEDWRFMQTHVLIHLPDGEGPLQGCIVAVPNVRTGS